MEGITLAAGKFDPARGSFITYAMWWVRGRVGDLVRKAVRDNKLPTVSGDAPDADGDGAYWDLIAGRPDTPDAGLDRADTRGAIAAALAGMPARHRRVIELRYGLDGDGQRTLSETGAEIGISKERVRQIEATALATLGTRLGPARESLVA